MKNLQASTAERHTRRAREGDELKCICCKFSSDGLTSVVSRARDKDNVAMTHLQTEVNSSQVTSLK